MGFLPLVSNVYVHTAWRGQVAVVNTELCPIRLGESGFRVGERSVRSSVGPSAVCAWSNFSLGRAIAVMLHCRDTLGTGCSGLLGSGTVGTCRFLHGTRCRGKAVWSRVAAEMGQARS